MAEVIPFKGYRYNHERIDNIGQVVAPPYDVISPQDQEILYERHPYNVIRLILGKHHAHDDEQDNVYTRAGQYLTQWCRDLILTQDSQPQFYLTAVDFKVGDRRFSRYGLLGVVGIQPFSKGIVLPHEHTFSKVKSEQLLLTKATKANLCPIFGLYGDDSGQMQNLQGAVAWQQPADVDLVDDDGSRHRLWCIRDEEIHAVITRFFQSKKIYIADGHHRYETALNYREELKAHTPDLSPDHPANYILISLSSMQDPGMVVLPAHRILKPATAPRLAEFKEHLADYFDLIPMAVEQEMPQKVLSLQAVLGRHVDKNALGVIVRDPDLQGILVLKQGRMAQRFGQEIPGPLQALDVTVLTHLILMELLGLDPADLDDTDKIVYCTSAQDAAAMVLEGRADAAFILNPTKIEQVQHVAEVGLTMPRKSTYFFPKVISGQVFHMLE